MLNIEMNTKQYASKSQRQDKAFKRGWTRMLHRYGERVTKRMSRVHLYKNRTGDLSSSNTYKVTAKAKRLRFKNKMFYAHWVRRWERRKTGSDAWSNAIAYYRRRFIKDLDELGKTVGKMK
ncbi:MAG: hypothetical protein GY928_37510 [Colwellia sp.]|nr:hypothetical protein [Colwellia sp.]